MRYKRNVYESFVLIMQFGLNMIVPILLCTALGVYIGDKTGHPFWVVPLFFIGAVAGFQNIWRMAKRIYTQESRRDRRVEDPTKEHVSADRTGIQDVGHEESKHFQK